MGAEHMSRRVFVKSAIGRSRRKREATNRDFAPGGVLHRSIDANPTSLSLADAAQLVRHKKISPVGVDAGLSKAALRSLTSASTHS